MTSFFAKGCNLTVFDSFNILNTSLRVFGLSSLKYSNKNGVTKYEISFFSLIYSLLISLLIIYVLYIQLIHFKPIENYFVLTMLHCYLVTSGTLMTVLVIATGVYNTRPFLDILTNKIYSSVFEVPLNNRDMSLVCLNQLLLSFIFLVSAFVWDSLSTGRNVTWSLVIQLLIYFIFPVYNALCITHFCVTIFWLKCLQRHVNRNLGKLLRVKNNRAKNGGWRRNEGESDPNVLLSDDIRELRGLCHNVHKVWKRIDSIFSTRNIFLLFHHCTLGTLYAYWALRHSFIKDGIAVTVLLNLFRSAVMSWVSVIRIIMPCNAAVSEAKQTTVIVNEFLTSDELFPPEVEELRIFSVQLLKERAVFAPYEFFDLSNQTLLRMLATVTSYLIILLQYNILNAGALRQVSNSTYSE